MVIVYRWIKNKATAFAAGAGVAAFAGAAVFESRVATVIGIVLMITSSVLMYFLI